MTCDEAAEQLSLRAYHQLLPETRQAFHAHLAGCAGCRTEEAALGRTLEWLDEGLPAPEPLPADFLAGVQARLAPERTAARRVRWLKAAALPLVEAALILLAVHLWSRPAPEALASGQAPLFGREESASALLERLGGER